MAGGGPKGDENRTPRIPEPVIGALLRWSLKYIDLFSVDIFTARAELTALESRLGARPRRRLNDVLDRVGAWIDARRQSGRGIPEGEMPVGGVGRGSGLWCASARGGEGATRRLVIIHTG